MGCQLNENDSEKITITLGAPSVASSFFELFPVLSKEYVVATFLAILEMAKSKELIITQNDTFDDIICEVANEK